MESLRVAAEWTRHCRAFHAEHHGTIFHGAVWTYLRRCIAYHDRSQKTCLCGHAPLRGRPALHADAGEGVVVERSCCAASEAYSDGQGRMPGGSFRRREETRRAW